MKTKILHKYFVFYFITAQFILIPKRLCWKYLKWFPSIVHFLITIACIYILNTQSYLIIFRQVGFISELYTLVSALPSISTIAMNIFASKKQQTILKMLIDLQTYMEQTFDTKFRSVELTRRHNFKVFFVMGIFTSSATYRLVYIGTMWNRLIDAPLITLYFFEVVFLLYFLLHIDLLYCILHFLNTNLDEISRRKNRSDIQSSDQFHYISYLHRKIWKIKRKIEDRFGWILLMVLLKNFVDIMNFSYWIFWSLDNSRGTMIILRKYVVNDCQLVICIFCTALSDLRNI